MFCLFTILTHKKKIHALVIPKGKYIDLDDFSEKASTEEMVGLLKGINTVAKKLGISVDFNRKLDATRKQGPFEKINPEFANYV